MTDTKCGKVLDYDRFKGRVLDEVCCHYGETAQVCLKRVVKNNGVINDALVITREGAPLSPAIYLNDMYGAYYSGDSDIRSIVRQVVRLAEEDSSRRSFDPSFISDFDRARQITGFKLISYDRNAELLKDVPCRRNMDLAMVYVCYLRDTPLGNATILIKNDMAQKWGVGEKELYGVALENMPTLMPLAVKDLEETISGLMPGFKDTVPEGAFDVRILTNDRGMFGAGVIFYPGVLSSVADEYGGDLYILPSSVHEVLALPANGMSDPEDLGSMVRDVNRAVVSPGEVLSDRVYFYDRDRDSLTVL